MVILTQKQYEELYSMICDYSNHEFYRGMDVSVFGVNSVRYSDDQKKSDKALNDIIHFFLDHSYDTEKVSFSPKVKELPFPDVCNYKKVIYEDDGNMTSFDESDCLNCPIAESGGACVC